MNTMTVHEFKERAGITGFLLTRNGPRLYIDGVRRRWHPSTNNVSQRAYICLTTYTAHCITQSHRFGTWWCKRESDKVKAILAPVARLARIHRVTVDGDPAIVTQSRAVFSVLHAAGVSCTLEPTRLFLDMDVLVRTAEVPYLPVARAYEVALQPVTGHDLFNRRFTCRESLDIALDGNILRGLEVVVFPPKEHDSEVVDRLLIAARDILHTTTA